MCDGLDDYYNELYERQLRETTFRDRRNNLEPLQNLVWQLKRRKTKGKLLELKKATNAFRLEGKPNNLGALKYIRLKPSFGLIISFIPTETCVQGQFSRNSYVFMVLINEDIYLIEESEVDKC